MPIFYPFADVAVQPIDIPVQTADVPDQRAKYTCIRNALLISIFELGKNSPRKLQSIFEKRLRSSCTFTECLDVSQSRIEEWIV